MQLVSLGLLDLMGCRGPEETMEVLATLEPQVFPELLGPRELLVLLAVLEDLEPPEQ